MKINIEQTKRIKKNIYLCEQTLTIQIKSQVYLKRPIVFKKNIFSMLYNGRFMSDSTL